MGPFVAGSGWECYRKCGIKSVSAPGAGRLVPSMSSKIKIAAGIFALVAAICVGLLWWAFKPSCPLTIKMATVNHRSLTKDGVTRPYSVITLRVKNQENILVMGRVVQPSRVRVDGRWDETLLVNVSAAIGPGQEAAYIIFARGTPDRCAIQVEYERGTWRTRLWRWFGPGGQKRIEKMATLNKWLNPKLNSWFPKSDDWQRATLETALPTAGFNSVGGNQPL